VAVEVLPYFYPQVSQYVMYGNLRRHFGELLRKLAEQKECRIEEGHFPADHLHMVVSIPPKYAVSSVVGFLKGKSVCGAETGLPEAKLPGAG
jgi:putative transposase